MAELFIAFTVLLGGEQDMDGCSGRQAGEGNGGGIVRGPGYFEGDITQAEGGGIVGTIGVLSGAKEEKETKDEAVSNAKRVWCGRGGVIESVDGAFDEWKWDRFDAFRRWVILAVASEQLGNGRYQFSIGGQARIYRSQVGQRLSNRPKVVLH